MNNNELDRQSGQRSIGQDSSLRKHVLVVDDNQQNLEVVGMFLKDAGYQISLAQDANASLAITNDLKPDLILLDVMMPETDGFELCRRLKKQEFTSNIPVVFLTARDDPKSIDTGFMVGAVDYIVKPFIKSEVLTRVKNHLQLADSREELLAMNRSREKLISFLSHDLRSPLSGIEQTLETLISGYIEQTSEVFWSNLNILKNRVVETRNMLDDMLEWGKFQDDAYSLFPESHNIRTLLDQCIQIHQKSSEKKNISIHNKIPAELEHVVDRVVFTTIFRNLISNAINHTQGHGSIQLSAERKNLSLSISIMDNGVGMPEDILHKIFVQGERYTSNGTDGEQGFGLGLVFVRDLIRICEGTVSAESTPGEGTEIIVTLPALN